MSARISVTGEIAEMEKQMGCMNGLLQLFDRHYFLNGRRMKQKSLPTARHNGNHLTEPPNSTLQKSPGKNVKVVKEKQRISTESSRTSCSSSTSCSSFSSLDNTRSAQVDPHLLSRAASTQHFLKHQTLNSRRFYQSPDVQDTLKNSSKREAHGLSLKTVSAKPALGHTLKPIDSPRPTPPLKFSNHRVYDSSVSPQAKPQERHLTIKGGMNGGNLVQVPKCTHRHSYDGTHRHSYDGRELYDTSKSSMRFKELPRLSLDSRDNRAKCSASRTRSSDRFKGTPSDQQDAPFSQRPSTVIAKLMGLEAFPNSTSVSENTIDASSSNKQHPLSRSTDLKSSNLTMNLSNSSRIPIQISPSNREVTTKSPRNPCSVYGEIEQRLATIEFKKSGKDLRALKQILESMQKTKELLDNKRAQASDITSQSCNTSILDNSSELSSPNMQRDKMTSPARTPISPKSSKSPIIIMKPAKITKKELNSASLGQPRQKVPELQKLQTDHFSDNRNEKLNNQQTADLTSRENHRRYIHPGHTSTKRLSSTEKRTNIKSLKTTQITKVPQHVNGEFSTNSGSIPGTLSPRLHLKIAMDKQSSSLSDSSRTRSEHIQLKTESCLAETNLKNKALHLQLYCNAQERCKRNEIRGLIPYKTAFSLQSKSIANLAQEGTSIYQFDKIASKTTKDDCKQKNLTTGLGRIPHMEESPTPSLEQPSPVSVLDSTFYPEDLSPVKKKLYAFKDDDSLNPIYEEVCLEWETQTPVRIKRLGADISKKLENIQQLRKNIYEQKCINEEKTMDCIYLSHEKENPRHRYISEILLASGILSNLDFSFAFLQLPSSGHLINPKLFFVLEQTQDSTWFSDDERSSVNMPKSGFNQKTQRRLVFDTVNEILAGKIEAEGSCKLSLSESVETCTKTKAQQLLKDLCAQVDQLQCANSSTHLDGNDNCSHMVVWDDLVRQSTNWKGCQNEVSVLALDIERLIFKDLITEVVIGEADDFLQSWSVGCCRRLFSA